MDVAAAHIYAAHLQTGRSLRNPLLALAVVLRNILLALATAGLGGLDVDSLAPAYVILTRKSDGEVMKRLAAGRQAGAGEAELAAVRLDLASLRVQDFDRRYDIWFERPARSSRAR